MITVWTKVTKASGSSWTKVPKATDPANPQIGQPIGLLLALTYSRQSIIDNWIRIAKASGTAWTKITKAT